MENRATILQKMKKEEYDVYSLAEKYYSIVSSLNSLGLTERELQLVAFTAIRGNVSYTEIKEDFCKKHNSSIQTINNMMSKLRRMGVFVKDNGKTKVHPHILLDFNKNIVLEIKLLHGQASVINS